MRDYFTLNGKNKFYIKSKKIHFHFAISPAVAATSNHKIVLNIVMHKKYEQQFLDWLGWDWQKTNRPFKGKWFLIQRSFGRLISYYKLNKFEIKKNNKRGTDIRFVSYWQNKCSFNLSVREEDYFRFTKGENLL